MSQLTFTQFLSESSEFASVNNLLLGCLGLGAVTLAGSLILTIFGALLRLPICLVTRVVLQNPPDETGLVSLVRNSFAVGFAVALFITLLTIADAVGWLLRVGGLDIVPWPQS